MGLVSCFKDDEGNNSLSNNGFEFVDIRSDGEVDKPNLDSLGNQGKHWIFVIQKVKFSSLVIFSRFSNWLLLI